MMLAHIFLLATLLNNDTHHATTLKQDTYKNLYYEDNRYIQPKAFRKGDTFKKGDHVMVVYNKGNENSVKMVYKQTNDPYARYKNNFIKKGSDLK